MECTCTRCNVSADHQVYQGARPDFTEGFTYLVCNNCTWVFNAANSTEGVQSDILDICETILADSVAKFGCYIFGPASDGDGGAFKYQYTKRCQLKDSLPKLSSISKLLGWSRFPEEDMPSVGVAPTGPLTRQEMRLIERQRRNGVCPILIFFVFSPGTIPELDVAAILPENSIIFLPDKLRSSLVGHDKVIDLRSKGAVIYYYSPDGGCHLRAFSEDFVIQRIAHVKGLVDAEHNVSAELARLGFRKRRRRRK